MKTIIDTTSLPANLIIANNTDEVINLPLYPDNGAFLLNPEDQIIYKVDHAREYAYYYTTCKGLGLSLSESE